MHTIEEKKRIKKRRRKIRMFVNVVVWFGIFLAGFFLGTRVMGCVEPTDTQETAHAHSKEEYWISLQGMSQENIPTGCESVSLAVVLNYWGVDITPEELIENYLPKGAFWYENGNLYGPNPHEKFVGDPFKKNSLGCFSEVIVETFQHLKSDHYPRSEKLQIRNLSGKDFGEFVEYLKEEIPVIVWATMGMEPSYEGMQFLLEDGSLYTWRANEHCMVLCGVDEENYYLMDPLQEGTIVSYEKEYVETRYEEMGKEAVIIWGE